MKTKSSRPTVRPFLGMSHEGDSAPAYKHLIWRTRRKTKPPLSCSFWPVFVCSAPAKIVNGQLGGCKPRIRPAMRRGAYTSYARAITFLSRTLPIKSPKFTAKIVPTNFWGLGPICARIPRIPGNSSKVLHGARLQDCAPRRTLRLSRAWRRKEKAPPCDGAEVHLLTAADRQRRRHPIRTGAPVLPRPLPPARRLRRPAP